MITESQMYWLTRLDHVKQAIAATDFMFGLLCFLAIGAGIALVCFGTFFGKGPYDALGGYENGEADLMKKAMRRNGIRLMVASAILFVLSTFASFGNSLLPTTKEMAAIYVVPKIANSQTVHELGNGIVDLTKEWIEELRPTRKSSSGQ